jgi:hypothetical protein
MSFFSRAVMAEITEAEVTGSEAIEGLRFSIHFDVDPQELNQLFQAGFFNLVGHGILHPRPDRPPFQPPQNFPGILFLHMCQCSPKSPLMTVGKKLSTSLSLTTVVGPLCHYLYHHQLIPMFKFLMLFHQYNPRMLAKD